MRLAVSETRLSNLWRGIKAVASAITKQFTLICLPFELLFSQNAKKKFIWAIDVKQQAKGFRNIQSTIYNLALLPIPVMKPNLTACSAAKPFATIPCDQSNLKILLFLMRRNRNRSERLRTTGLVRCL